jgi:hypothetical protein
VKKFLIPIIVVLVILITLPLFGQRRGRRSRQTETSPLTVGFYGGMEDLTDSTRYFSLGGEAILPVVTPIKFRVTFLRFDMPEAGNTINVGTGFFGGDVMYYWQAPMVFTPYGFAGLWYNSSPDPLVEDETISTITLHAGVGGQMPGLYNFFLEGGIDYLKVGDADADTPIFIHGGIRFSLFR